MADLTYLHRCDLFDETFRVRVRGTSPDDAVPVDAVLEDALVEELAPVLARHDFARRPIATGFAGDRYAWRVARVAQGWYVMRLERSRLPRSVTALARRFDLSLRERADLRHTVGGYDLADLAARSGESVEELATRRASVLDKCGARTVAELLALAS